MKNKDGYAVHITPGKFMAIHETDLSLDEIRELLECDIFEVVHLRGFPIPKIVMLVDECGKLRDKSINPIASILYAEGADYIAGEALLCKLEYTPGDGYNIAPLGEKEAEIVAGLVQMIVGAFVGEDIKKSAKAQKEA